MLLPTTKQVNEKFDKKFVDMTGDSRNSGRAFMQFSYKVMTQDIKSFLLTTRIEDLEQVIKIIEGLDNPFNGNKSNEIWGGFEHGRLKFSEALYSQLANLKKHD